MSKERNRVQPPRGTQDLFDDYLKKIERVTAVMTKVARSYGFCRVDTPVLEHLEVFTITDSARVEKCYTFKDKSGRDLVMRPDINAPLSRFVINNCLSEPVPIKLFFVDKVFRYRHSRKREFRMFGVESFGDASFDADAEGIRLVSEIVEELGLPEIMVEYANPQIYYKYLEELLLKRHLPVEDAPNLLRELRFAKTPEQKIFAMTARSLGQNEIDQLMLMLEQNTDTDSFSVLNAAAGNSDVLAQELVEIERFRDTLAACGLSRFGFNLGALHGAGFYSGVTYQLRFQGTDLEVGDGGRYDNFVELLSGKKLPATGIGLGVERLIRFCDELGISIVNPKSGVLVVTSDTVSIRPVLKELRAAGAIIECVVPCDKRPVTVHYGRSKGYKFIVFLSTSTDGSGLFSLETVDVGANEKYTAVQKVNMSQLRDILSKVLS